MNGPEIVTRAEAKARGLKRYFTGMLCKNGHLDERQTLSGVCAECHRIYGRKTESKIVRMKNRFLKLEKYRASQRDWKRRNRDKYLAQQREWRKKNRDHMRKWWSEYHITGPKNPKGELGWVRKNQAQLRSVKRLLKSLSHGQVQSPSSGSTTPTGSRK